MERSIKQQINDINNQLEKLEMKLSYIEQKGDFSRLMELNERIEQLQNQLKQLKLK